MTEADLYRLKSFKSLIKLEIELLIVCGPMPRYQKYFLLISLIYKNRGFKNLRVNETVFRVKEKVKKLLLVMSQRSDPMSSLLGAVVKSQNMILRKNYRNNRYRCKRTRERYVLFSIYIYRYI